MGGSGVSQKRSQWDMKIGQYWCKAETWSAAAKGFIPAGAWSVQPMDWSR